jgi:hypothetical protein
MITDNGSEIFEKLRNKKAVFIKILDGGITHYVAANRAARRFLASKGVNGTVDLEEMSVS